MSVNWVYLWILYYQAWVGSLMLVESLLRLVIKMLETSSERNFAGPQWNSANLYTANDTASNLFTYLHCRESLGILCLSLRDCFLSMFV